MALTDRGVPGVLASLLALALLLVAAPVSADEPGVPQASGPAMGLDIIGNGVVVYSPFVVSGWAIDQDAAAGTGVNTVHVWAFPRTTHGAMFLGVASYGLERLDVGAAYGSRYLNSGFTLTTPAFISDWYYATKQYDIVAYAFSTATGSFNQFRVATLFVGGPWSWPDVRIDVPAAGATVSTPFVVAGWAIDGSAATGTGVDEVVVYASPRYPSSGPTFLLGRAEYGAARADVARIYGSRFLNSGYHLTVPSLPPGAYNITVYARRVATSGGTMTSRPQAVTVVGTQTNPAMSLDLPRPGSTPTQPLRVAGWAVDLAATGGTGVSDIHVYAFPTTGASPIFLGYAVYGIPRLDVGAVFGGQFTNSGYNLVTSVALTAGQYDIVAYARLSATLNWTWQLSRVTIP